MTRATKVKKARRNQPPPKPQARLSGGLLFLAGLSVVGILAAGALLLAVRR